MEIFLKVLFGIFFQATKACKIEFATRKTDCLLNTLRENTSQIQFSLKLTGCVNPALFCGLMIENQILIICQIFAFFLKTILKKVRGLVCYQQNPIQQFFGR